MNRRCTSPLLQQDGMQKQRIRQLLPYLRQIGVPIGITEYPQLSSLAAELWTPCCPLRVKVKIKQSNRIPVIPRGTHTAQPGHVVTAQQTWQNLEDNGLEWSGGEKVMQASGKCLPVAPLVRCFLGRAKERRMGHLSYGWSVHLEGNPHS